MILVEIYVIVNSAFTRKKKTKAGVCVIELPAHWPVKVWLNMNAFLSSILSQDISLKIIYFVRILGKLSSAQVMRAAVCGYGMLARLPDARRKIQAGQWRWYTEPVHNKLPNNN